MSERAGDRVGKNGSRGEGVGRGEERENLKGGKRR